VGLWDAYKTELPHLVGGGDDQPGLWLWSDNSSISDHIGQSGSEQPQTSIATWLVGRRNQQLLTSQPSGETTSEIPPGADSPSDQGKQDLKNPC
jgi:hypothetical protein